MTIVGAGIAGLAAGCALADAGYRVQLLERRPYVGGRASSYEHPAVGEVVDNCQHILLGCCTNLIAFYQRLGIEDQISWFSQYTYVEPGGRRSVIAPSRLPAPLHASLDFLRAPAFSLADKLSIARGALHFLRGLPADSTENFAQWCKRTRQTQGAIDRFWRLLLSSALNDDLNRLSVHYAAKVVRESFLNSPKGGRMGIPKIPLSELYAHAAAYICERGGQVHTRSAVDSIERTGQGWRFHFGGRSCMSDRAILALSFEGMQKLLPLFSQTPGAGELATKLASFEHSPISSIHLWFDREITELPKAILLDATIDWMYQVSKLQPGRHPGPGSYIELVVSNSKNLVAMERQAIIDLAMRELPLYFPAVSEAKLLKAAVLKEVRATFAVTPDHDRMRPGQRSPWEGIYLAGDWTATGWPATMEGAVRSGFLAAEALTEDLNAARSFLARDLRPSGLMRLFA